jgi:uncharacterized protein with PQ loop repeat
VNLTELLLFLGYALLTICYVPQWWRVFRTRRVEGLSPVFICLVFLGLCLIQIGLVLGRISGALIWGNGFALINAGLLLVAYFSVRNRGVEHGPA